MTVLARRPLVPLLGAVLALVLLAGGLGIGHLLTAGQPEADGSPLTGENTPERGLTASLPTTEPDDRTPGAPPEGLAALDGFARGWHDGGMPHEREAAFHRWWDGLEAAPEMVHWSEGWPGGEPGAFPANLVSRVHESGAVPVISWEPRDPAWLDPDVDASDGLAPPVADLEAIADGAVDAQLSAWAGAASAADGPVLVRPLPDANGFWYPWGELATGEQRQRYREAWRRISAAFDAAGAEQVRLVWSLSAGEAFEPEQVRELHPGAEHVDVAAITAVLWGDDVAWGPVEGVAGTVSEPLAALERHEHEVLVLAGVPHAGVGERDQAGVVEELAEQLGDDGDVAGVVWLHDRIEGADFRLDPDAAAAALAEPGDESERG